MPTRFLPRVLRGFALLLIVASCGKSTARHRDDAGRPSDAKVVDAEGPRDASIQSMLDQLVPLSPPPPPIVRKFKRGDCKTSYAPRPDRDPNPMCRIEGGEFMYGGGMRVVIDPAVEGQREVQVPATKTTVRAFVIDQYEVTAAQAALFLNAHGNVCDGLDQKQNPGDVPMCVWIEPHLAGIEKVEGRFVARRGQEQIREGYFTWEGAARYCAWVGKRVPSSAQWEYAARHDPATKRDLLYPWGDTWLTHAAACNDKPCDLNPPGPYPPQRDRFRVGAFDGTGGRLDSSSPWGLHDTAGGGHELVFECADPNETCKTGEPCRCKFMMTSSDSEPGIERLRLDYRVDDTAIGFGIVAVRCASAAPN